MFNNIMHICTRIYTVTDKLHHDGKYLKAEVTLMHYYLSKGYLFPRNIYYALQINIQIYIQDTSLLNIATIIQSWFVITSKMKF